MSNSYTTTDLEARVVELETLLQKQNEKIGLLGAVAITSGYQALFVDPLQKFFDAPEFWEVIVEDNTACINACIKDWRQTRSTLLAELMAETVANNRERFAEIDDRLLECYRSCGGLFPGL